jgi:hypothetical protein
VYIPVLLVGKCTGLGLDLDWFVLWLRVENEYHAHQVEGSYNSKAENM